MNEIMEALVTERESGMIVAHYVGVVKIKDTFDERGLLCYCIILKDGSTATFNKIDHKVYKKVWTDA